MIFHAIQHSVLCITDKNESLGLIDMKLFDYEQFNTEIHQHHRTIEEKADRYWLDALSAMHKKLGVHDKKIITVADREGDFYEFLSALKESNEEFVIRAKHNRYTGENYRQREAKLWSLLEESESIGNIKTTIQDVNTRQIKEMTLSLKALTVTLPVPNKSKIVLESKKSSKPIILNVVQVFSENHEWVLLTSLPIETKAQIEEIMSIYRARWQVNFLMILNGNQFMYFLKKKYLKNALH